jgi:type 1 glutamine amidotransferase
MRKRLVGTVLLAVLATLLAVPPAEGQAGSAKIRVLIIDGQNNHNWRITTPFMKKALEDCGRFSVDVATTPEKPKAPAKPKTKEELDSPKYKELQAQYAKAQKPYQEAMAKFRPGLDKVDVVLSNYNGELWSKEFQQDFDAWLKSGKGSLVIVHAANNAFGGWNDYNLMIGMGWRGNKGGARLLLDDAGKEIRIPSGEGDGSGHRYTGPFQVVVRNTDHPITKGMPREWMHAQDELYDNMRGPIENVNLLATAYSKGTKVHEPMIWTVSYGKGRVFHTPMGHDLNGMRCIGFVTTLQRGTEWAATGKVTLPIPRNFPTSDKTSSLSK